MSGDRCSKPHSFFNPAYHASSSQSAGGLSATSFGQYNTRFKPILDFKDNGEHSTHVDLIYFLTLSLVPIYDGQEANFHPNKDMDNLHKLPLWQNGTQDIPAQSLAVVGYTVHTYRKRNVDKIHLSTNLQWLIVLGVVSED